MRSVPLRRPRSSSVGHMLDGPVPNGPSNELQTTGPDERHLSDKQNIAIYLAVRAVRPLGFEPRTCGLEGLDNRRPRALQLLSSGRFRPAFVSVPSSQLELARVRWMNCWMVRRCRAPA